MNARMARKSAKESERYLQPEKIWGKGRVEKARSVVEKRDQWRQIFRSSCMAARLLRLGRTADAKAHWAQLRVRIIAHWCGPIDDVEKQWGEAVAISKATLPGDLECYSDRWTAWRVAAIDYAMESL